jgi:predicted RNA binding protein YcfA (HicA-like mRNA interferase family)
MKVRDAIRRLEADGWRLIAIKGDHRQFKHPTRRGRVTVPGHPSDELKQGTWLNIQRQAGWRK